MDTLTFKVYQGTWTNSPNPADLKETKTVQFIVNVDQFLYLDAGVGNVGNYMNLDFEEMEDGELMELDLRIVSNTNYNVSAQSQNSQLLVHSDTNITTTSPYEFRVNNKAKDLSTGSVVEILTNEKSTDADGDTHVIKIELPDPVPHLTKGNYSDQIVITLTSL